MRFHGMVGDHVTISTSGKGWRPPDYIITPTTELRGDVKKQIVSHGQENERETNSELRLPQIPQNDVKTSPGVNLSTTTNMEQEKFGNQRQRNGVLPLPCTNYQPRLRSLHTALIKKIVVIVITLSVALSLLGSMVTIFSERLKVIESALEQENQPGAISSQNFKRTSRNGRELASIGTGVQNYDDTYDRESWHPWVRFKETTESTRRLLQLLSKLYPDLPRGAVINTASMAEMVLHSSGVARTDLQLIKDKNLLPKDQGSTSTATMSSRRLQSSKASRPVERTSDRASSNHMRQILDKSRAERNHAYLLNISSQLLPRHPTFASRSSEKDTVPNAIEIWDLPQRKSICRIYDVGRLPNGTLVLPKWMKRHAVFLEKDCGVRGAIYALQENRGRGSIDRVRSLLNTALRTKVNVVTRHSDRDLFGTVTPRVHMPHFVADILVQFLAAEVLLGSGKGKLRSLTLTPTAENTAAAQPLLTFPDFRPSVLVPQQPLNLPTSHWVTNFAQFFTHPQVGFTLISTGKATASSGRPDLPVSMLRSVVSTNINPYHPYGLFGSKGENFVFSLNGVSREPSWTTEGMKRYPCRVVVTALTRNGSRQLLRIHELQEKIEAFAKVLSLEIDFRVVDFGEMPFEEQLVVSQETNVLIAAHGAGNANFIFMRPSAAVIEVFPFAYKAGPFDGFAKIFDLDYSSAMSIPQTKVFKDCMQETESNEIVRKEIFAQWDKAVEEEKKHPWIHMLNFEKAEKAGGNSGALHSGMQRRCARMQPLEFDVDAVASKAVASGRAQCITAQYSQ